MNFDGMTTKPGLSLLASFVQHSQNFNDSSGLVEFGTYRGRVSSMLGQLKREKDELHLVDISDYLNHEMMKSLGLNYSFHKTSSENLSPNQMCDKFYFSHHDASHYFSNVTHELNIMKTLMEKNGVIALDDFTDPYNQVRAAYYHNRYANKYPFELLSIGFGK